MSLSFILTAEIPASAERIYNAWLDSNEHALMTEADSAIASHEVGAEYQAHGGYISGKNLELIPNHKIVQSWRSTSFKDSDPDSTLEVQLVEKGANTEITLIHSGVPEAEHEVESGWVTYYFEPMKEYFSSNK